jgi:hemerythrin
MFEFTQDCILGVEVLDNDHRHLFDLIHRVMHLLHNEYLPDDKYSQIKEALEELDEYADLHFEREEAYMEKIRDPELILQRSQHMVFRNKVRSWEFKDIDEIDDQVVMLEEMMQFLAEWLYQHIIASDSMIGKMPPLEEWMMKENICEFSEEYCVGI